MADSIEFTPTTLASISVGDLKSAIAWYGEKLGFSLVYSADEVGWAELSSPLTGFSLGLFAEPAEAGKGANVVVTFGVVDVDAARATMEARGVEFAGPTDTMEGMVKLATFKDPDGNTFMIAQTLMEA